jgi:hypothetical protein
MSSHALIVMLVAWTLPLVQGRLAASGQAAPNQQSSTGRMVPAPEDPDAYLDQLNRKRTAALPKYLRQEADYYPCTFRASSKQKAEDCLTGWEVLANEYIDAEIKFWVELERRDTESVKVIKQEIDSLTRRQKIFQQSPEAAATKDEMATYQTSLEKVRQEIAAAGKVDTASGRVQNLESQASHLEAAIKALEYASAGVDSARASTSNSIELYRQLADYKEALLAQTRSSGTNARVQRQSIDTIRIERRAYIELAWRAPEPSRDRVSEYLVNANGHFEKLADCLAVSPTTTFEQCKNDYKLSFATFNSISDCRREYPKLTDTQCTAFLKK